MTLAAKPLPEGFHSINSYLVVDDAKKAVSFYEGAFGAEEIPGVRMSDPESGRILHTELRIGDSVLMLCDEFPDWGNTSPRRLGGSGVILALYLPDVDAAVKRAVNLGAKVLIPVADQFYGDRSGRIQDPFGHLWLVATHTREMTPEEMQHNYQEFLKSSSQD